MISSLEKAPCIFYCSGFFIDVNLINGTRITLAMSSYGFKTVKSLTLKFRCLAVCCLTPKSKIFSFSVVGSFYVSLCSAEIIFNCCAGLFCRRVKVAPVRCTQCDLLYLRVRR